MVGAIQIGDVRTELVAIHHLKRLVVLADGQTSSVRNLGSHTHTTLLGGDDDNTIRTTATVDSGGRSVFQHVEGLDILRVDR